MHPPSQHSTSLKSLFNSLWRNRNLWWQLTRRDVVGRYRGSIFGLAWSFFNPFLMLIIYTFVFNVVFRSRWGIGTEETKTGYAIVLFVGLIVHGFFAECINRAPGLIISNVNFVKKVIFPLEILPWVGIGSAFFHAMVSLIMLIAAMLVLSLRLNWTILLFPVVLLPLLLTTMGFSFFLTATGVYLRDIAQITGVFTSVLLFVSPIFYPSSALPSDYQVLLYINPLTFIVEESRKVIIEGNFPDFRGLICYTISSCLILWIGFWWFQKARKGFADVI
jgi:lipopolysaccharide transport system permease protein